MLRGHGRLTDSLVPHDRMAAAMTYEPENDIACIDLRGHLSFSTGANTRMKTGNLMVMDGGYLEVGSAAIPVAANVTAEIVITDQKIDRKLDPAEEVA